VRSLFANNSRLLIFPETNVFFNSLFFIVMKKILLSISIVVIAAVCLQAQEINNLRTDRNETTDDGKINKSLSQTASNRTTIFLESFDDSLGSFSAISIEGDQEWEWATFDYGCAKMSGYAAGTNFVNEDWLITPEISLYYFTDFELGFREAINYSQNVQGNHKVLLSTNYSGSGNPYNATWIELTFNNRPPGNSWDFYDCDPLDISAFAGETIHVAFKYLSSEIEAGTWEISNFEITTYADLEPFGTDSTFDIMTWNIQNFPKYGQLTMNYVCEIIQTLQVDVIALQEIDNLSQFIQMVNNCSGWEGYFNQNSSLDFIYNPETVEIVSVYPIYTGGSYQDPFPRRPLVMELLFMNQEIVIINNHLKAFGDSISVERRRAACILLDEYITTYLPDKKVILPGDLNDDIAEVPPDNVFQVFLDKTDEYLFADMDIASGPIFYWSYPNYPSHLDHIMISNELFDEFNQESSVVATLIFDAHFTNGWDDYYSYVSDHRPVAMKFVPNATTAVNNLQSEDFTCTISPNPFNHTATITFQSPSKNGMVVIYDLTGRMIEEYELSGGQTSLQWNAGRLPEGIYYVNIKTDNGTNTSMKAIKIK
jgi:endonuclease/exonuclease/phosphatase family metal-dependent hydrolase